MAEEKWEYKIESKPRSLILTIIMLAVFSAITALLYKNNNGAYIFTMLFCIAFVLLLLVSIYRIAFLKIYIGKDSFYHRSSFQKGKEYKFNDISEAWVSSGLNSNDTRSHYFNYKTNDGQTHKFYFENYQYDEIDILIDRINGDGT